MKISKAGQEGVLAAAGPLERAVQTSYPTLYEHRTAASVRLGNDDGIFELLDCLVILLAFAWQPKWPSCPLFIGLFAIAVIKAGADKGRILRRSATFRKTASKLIGVDNAEKNIISRLDDLRDGQSEIRSLLRDLRKGQRQIHEALGLAVPNEAHFLPKSAKRAHANPEPSTYNEGRLGLQAQAACTEAHPEARQG